MKNLCVAEKMILEDTVPITYAARNSDFVAIQNCTAVMVANQANVYKMTARGVALRVMVHYVRKLKHPAVVSTVTVALIRLTAAVGVSQAIVGMIEAQSSTIVV